VVHQDTNGNGVLDYDFDRPTASPDQPYAASGAEEIVTAEVTIE
jgi:hypothetical protein